MKIWQQIQSLILTLLLMAFTYDKYVQKDGSVKWVIYYALSNISILPIKFWQHKLKICSSAAIEICGVCALNCGSNKNMLKNLEDVIVIDMQNCALDDWGPLHIWPTLPMGNQDMNNHVDLIRYNETSYDGFNDQQSYLCWSVCSPFFSVTQFQSMYFIDMKRSTTSSWGADVSVYLLSPNVTNILSTTTSRFI